MKMPTPILSSLSKEYMERWTQYYVQPSDRKRTQEEGIWRRTQTPYNAEESGWTCPSDQRRRIVHYLNDFDAIQYDEQMALVISRIYLYYSLSLPCDEIEFDRIRLFDALAQGGWKNLSSEHEQTVWKYGDLLCTTVEWEIHPEDRRANRLLPYNYQSLDVIIQTPEVGNVLPLLPWEVLSKGMRVKDVRGQPLEVNDLSVLYELQPFHVEIGCGASIEAGVPALNYLHDLYRVTDRNTGQFIFGGQHDDLIPRLLCHPTLEVPRLGEMFSSAFTAELTIAHRALRLLFEKGYIVGPIMTNNFDGLIHRCGLPELFLRRYDEIVPSVQFDDRARSILVIGSHADRRRVQERARAKGLQVVFLDTEGYWDDGDFVSYPLEGPQNTDILCRKSATEGLVDLCKGFGIQV